MPGDLVDETGQQDRASEGFTMHGGAEPRGLGAVPRSALFEGPFGRMFRNLPFVAHDRNALIQLGLKMQEQPGVPADNPKIPVGYTYLGQFIDHDITFDPTSQPSPWRLCRGVEEVDQQLVDAFGLVVVDPVRGVG